MRFAIAVLVFVSVRSQRPGAPGNMNGAYPVASGDDQDVPYNTDYASKGHKYFDVWAPEIATLYGQVFWTDQGQNALPADIVEKFKGKVIAITGYEQDQVMVTPTGQPGVNPDKDVSVPINWAYNHHYMTWMTGAHSEMQYVKADLSSDHVDYSRVDADGDPIKYVAVDKPGAGDSGNTCYYDGQQGACPTSQFFSEGNGGESRRSYHGYPDGFAQLIESPQEWHITPMQIDTRNRDCGVTPADVHNCSDGFVPGLEPKQARYGRGIPSDNAYSGVLECPCNSRYGGDPAYYPDSGTKQTQHQYGALADGTCDVKDAVMTAASCYDAVAQLGFRAASVANKTGQDATLPAGCSFVEAADGSGAATAFFNTAASTAQCSAGTKRTGGADLADIGVSVGFELAAGAGPSSYVPKGKGKYCKLNRQDVQKQFEMAAVGLGAAAAALKQCEDYCSANTACWGCSVDCSVPGQGSDPSKSRCYYNAIPACGPMLDWAGLVAGDVAQKLQGGNVTITLSGPSDAWFGIGLDAQQMSDQPYTLIVNSTGVMEQKLGTCGSEAEHCAGTILSQSVTLLSNTVANDRRTVVLARPFAGKTTDHYTFSTATPTIKFIAAAGSSQAFAYHRAHTAGQLSLAAAPGAATCVCDAGAVGSMCETNFTNCGSFVKNCAPEPQGDLAFQRNPTCNSGQYGGGLRCCGHKRIMLDVDQDPGTDLLRYHMKFRFWYQEYVPGNATVRPSHYNLPRIYTQTETAAGEYDIPPAFAQAGAPIPGYPEWPSDKPTPGTTCTGTCPGGDDCECIHTIKFHWSYPGATRLIYAGGHCHAPSCIDMTLYRNDTGHEMEVVCRQVPQYGTGNVTHDRYDEPGYLMLPPCVWGDDAGLNPSILLPPGTPLVSIKRNRNTHTGHFGEMASWQMRGVSF